MSGNRGQQRGGAPRGRGGRAPAEIFQQNVPAQIDARINTSDQLVAAFKRLAVSNEKPLRPGYGTLGRAITLRANFFAIKLPKGPIYDYSVQILPKTQVKSQSMRSRIFQLMEQTPDLVPYQGYIAHDNSSRMVAAQELPQPFNFQIVFSDEGEPVRADPKVFDVEISWVSNLEISDIIQYLSGDVQKKDYDYQPFLSAMNLILQQHASSAAVRFGKNRYFFPSNERKPSLSPSLDAWRGYYSSVRPAYKQLMVNVNFCMTAFYHGGSLMDALNAYGERSRGASPQAFPQKLKIVTNHLGYPWKKVLKKVLGTTPQNTFFDCEEYGGKISVAEYFKRKYRINLRPNLPVVDVGGPDRSTYLPAEICSLAVNQPYTGKLTDTETASMIKVACNPPATNGNYIVNEGLGLLGLSQPLSPLQGFGITVDNKMAVVPARVLNPPRLSYRGGGSINARDGSWNILDVKFQKPGVLGAWFVIVVQDFGKTPFNGPQDPNLVQLTTGFWNKLKSSGIDTKIGPIVKPTSPLPPPQNDPGRQKALDIIENTMKSVGTKPSLVLFLLSGRDDFIYPGIKKLCDMKLGVASICMLLSKALVPAKQDQYFSNVALKVNTKLGGVNHLIDDTAMKWLKDKSTMMVGMDVTHPGPNSALGTPSVAAVVASTDNTFSQFPVSLRLQETKVEIIQDLEKMMIERLQAYKAKSKALPERVFVYRDGVSEGQFDLVIKDELPQIRSAFQKLKDGTKTYNPRLSIMICGKRHHARFFPTTSADAAQNGNTLPGTVVDKGVTSVFTFDFYLQAHAGLQGTVRPTHYTVVYDENKFDADTVQQGTHTASYLYVRATKAVSLVPAAYYADLACERARCYINRLFVAGEGASSAGGKRDKEAQKKRVYEEAQKMWGNGIHESLKETMFYV